MSSIFFFSINISSPEFQKFLNKSAPQLQYHQCHVNRIQMKRRYLVLLAQSQELCRSTAILPFTEDYKVGHNLPKSAFSGDLKHVQRRHEDFSINIDLV
jgi:hypothetical protein